MSQPKILSDELIQRSIAIRNAHHESEIRYHRSKWSISEDLLALSNNIGSLGRLAMARQGRRYPEQSGLLEQTLAENIWWLIELAHRLNVDIQAEMEHFLAMEEAALGIDSGL